MKILLRYINSVKPNADKPGGEQRKYRLVGKKKKIYYHKNTKTRKRP